MRRWGCISNRLAHSFPKNNLIYLFIVWFSFIFMKFSFLNQSELIVAALLTYSYDHLWIFFAVTSLVRSQHFCVCFISRIRTNFLYWIIWLSVWFLYMVIFFFSLNLPPFFSFSSSLRSSSSFHSIDRNIESNRGRIHFLCRLHSSFSILGYYSSFVASHVLFRFQFQIFSINLFRCIIIRRSIDFSFIYLLLSLSLSHDGVQQWSQNECVCFG